MDFQRNHEFEQSEFANSADPHPNPDEQPECQGNCNYLGEEHEGEVKKVRVDADDPELATADLPHETYYCRRARVRDKQKGFEITVIEEE